MVNRIAKTFLIDLKISVKMLNMRIVNQILNIPLTVKMSCTYIFLVDT